jgi:hypothetical protein
VPNARKRAATKASRQVTIEDEDDDKSTSVGSTLDANEDTVMEEVNESEDEGPIQVNDSEDEESELGEFKPAIANQFLTKK